MISSAASATSPHRIGYARVSSVGQNLDSQMDALQQAGCGKIFSEKMTGSRMDRPAWDQVLEYVRAGDTLVVTELRRMTRSLLDLLETTKALEQRQVNLVSLRENIDTTTATGRCFLSMMGGCSSGGTGASGRASGSRTHLCQGARKIWGPAAGRRRKTRNSENPLLKLRKDRCRGL